MSNTHSKANHDHPHDKTGDEKTSHSNKFQTPQDYFKHIHAMWKKMGYPLGETSEHHSKYEAQMHTISEMKKMVSDLFKTLAKMQSDYSKEMFERFNNLMREVSTHKGPIDVSKYNDHFQNGLKRAMDHSLNVGEVIKKAHKTMATHSAHKSKPEDSESSDETVDVEAKTSRTKHTKSKPSHTES